MKRDEGEGQTIPSRGNNGHSGLQGELPAAQFGKSMKYKGDFRTEVTEKETGHE